MVWLNYILAQSEVPWQVISNSYADDEDTVPPSYAQSVCAGFAQLGARGVSVFFGSGDAGVEGVQPGGNCTLNTNPNKKAFVPCFPGSCPYVTTIGCEYYALQSAFHVDVELTPRSHQRLQPREGRIRPCQRLPPRRWLQQLLHPAVLAEDRG